MYTAHFRRAGLDAAATLTQAKGIIIVLSAYFGGRVTYIPQGDKINAVLRDAEIWRNPDGLDVAALAARYGLTRTRIYGILRKQRAIKRYAAAQQSAPNRAATGI